jgi:hypothetical protein
MAMFPLKKGLVESVRVVPESVAVPTVTEVELTAMENLKPVS